MRRTPEQRDVARMATLCHSILQQIWFYARNTARGDDDSARVASMDFDARRLLKVTTRARRRYERLNPR